MMMYIDQNGEELWDSTRAAVCMGLSPATVRSYLRRGLLSGVKDHGRYFLRASECERYIRERRRPGNPAWVAHSLTPLPTDH